MQSLPTKSPLLLPPHLSFAAYRYRGCPRGFYAERGPQVQRGRWSVLATALPAPSCLLLTLGPTICSSRHGSLSKERLSNASQILPVGFLPHSARPRPH